MPRLDLIEAKIQAIESILKSLRAGESIAIRVGGKTLDGPYEEINFQEKRLEVLKWASYAGEEQIKDRIDELASSLSEEELACKYGIVRGLSEQAFAAIAHIEDLEIALGVHPGVI